MRLVLLLLLPFPWLYPAALYSEEPAPPVPAAPAAAAVPLSLTEAVRLALAKNFTIEVARYEPLIAQARQVEAGGAFDPVLASRYTAANGVGTVDSNPLSNTPPAFYTVKNDTLETSLGGQLPFGLNYSLVGSVNNQRGSYNSFADSFYTFGGIRLRQPLLRGLGFGPNLVGIRLARANRAIADAGFRQAVTDTVTRTITVYNNLFFAQRAYQIAVHSRELAAALLRENRRRLEVGSMSSADVTIAEARVARLVDGVLQAERDLHDAQNYFRALITSDTHPAVETPLVIEPPLERPAPTLDKAADLARALAHRPDYQQAQQNVRRAEVSLAESRSRVLPQVDLVGSYGYNGAGTSFDQSYRDARTGNTSSWTAGAELNLPLTLREGRGKYRAAKLTLAQARAALGQAEQGIVVEVANAAGQIETTARRVEANRQARGLAQQSLSAEEKRLQVGQSNTFTVLQFQELLSYAQMAEDRAIADFNIALASYDRAIGATLAVHGIELTENVRH